MSQTWTTTYTTLNSVSSLSGTGRGESILWQCLNKIYNALTGYWSSNAYQIILTQEPITKISGYYWDNTGIALSAALEATTYSVTTASINNGWFKNTITPAVPAATDFLHYELSGGTSGYYGSYDPPTTGTPGTSIKYYGTYSSDWHHRVNTLRSSADAVSAGQYGYWPLAICGAVTSFGYTTGYGMGKILELSALTGVDSNDFPSGWLNTFFDLHTSYKRALLQYNICYYSPSGLTSATSMEELYSAASGYLSGRTASATNWFPVSALIGGYPVGGLTATSSILPLTGTNSLSAIHKYYYDSYVDVAEYIYGWTSLRNSLTAISAQMDTISGYFEVQANSGNLLSCNSISTTAFNTLMTGGRSGLSAILNHKRFLYTANDSCPEVRLFRETMDVVKMQVQYDKDHIYVSSTSAADNIIWDAPARNVLHYLMAPIVKYNVMRDVFIAPTGE